MKYWRKLPRRAKGMIILVLGAAVIVIGGYIFLQLYSRSQTDSSEYISRWFNDPTSRSELITISRERCGDAPFILPTDGFIGLLWRDPAGPYDVFNRHTGLDIFGDGEPGEIPIYAAYEGYLTRLSTWISSVIIEHVDPLNPERKIWTYYTHMASIDGDPYILDAFPPGTDRVWVEQGTLIGYQGEYNGNSFPIGLHLHFSLVKSDANGNFLNEAELGNTLDPSPYLGLPVNIDRLPPRPIRCEKD